MEHFLPFFALFIFIFPYFSLFEVFSVFISFFLFVLSSLTLALTHCCKVANAAQCHTHSSSHLYRFCSVRWAQKGQISFGQAKIYYSIGYDNILLNTHSYALFMFAYAIATFTGAGCQYSVHTRNYNVRHGNVFDAMHFTSWLPRSRAARPHQHYFAAPSHHTLVVYSPPPPIYCN